MIYRLVFTDDTYDELYFASLWYRKQSFNVADQFLSYIDSSLTIIATHPEIYPLFYKNIRRALVKKFPYSIFYRIENLVIKIISIFHNHRDHEEWKKLH